MAASSKGIRAGKAFVELFADDSKVMKTLAKSQKVFQAWGRMVTATGAGVSAAGATIAAPMTAALLGFASAGRELDTMSKRTRVSVEDLSRLGYAAEQSGADMAAVEGGLGGLQAFHAQLKAGSADARIALNQLGVSAKDLMGKSPEQQFLLMAEAVSRVQDPVRRATLANQVFGGSAEALLPMLNKGAKGIAELMGQADALGITMSGQDAEAAAAFSNALGSLWGSVKGVSNAIGAALAPILTGLVEKVTAVVAVTKRWIDDNRGLIRTAAMIAGGLMAAGAVIAALGATLFALGAAAGVVASVLSAVGAVVGFILSPFGLLIAAVAALGVAFIQYIGGIGAAMTWLRDLFGPLVDTVVEAFGAMKDAMAAGEWQAAADLLWTGIKLAWTKGVDYLNGLWVKFKSGFLTVWSDVTTAFAKAWRIGVDFCADAWDVFVNGIQTKLAEAQSGTADWLLYVASKIPGSGVNYEEASATLAEDTQRKIGGFSSDRDKRIGDREKERNDALAAIDEDAKRKADARVGMFDDDLAKSSEAVKKAQEEYAKALGTAKTAAASGGQNGTEGTNPLQGILDALKGGQMALANNVQTGGTFSAGAARMFSPTAGETKQEQLQKKGNEILSDIKDNTAGGKGKPGAAQPGGQNYGQ